MAHTMLIHELCYANRDLSLRCNYTPFRFRPSPGELLILWRDCGMILHYCNLFEYFP